MPELVDDAVQLDDARAIRAIAHPARLVVLDALYDQGLELTATQAAELAGITPSAMSYHLRALERFGIVRRAESGGDARERPWTRVAKNLTIRPPAPGSSRAVSLAAGAVLSTAFDVLRERLFAALERTSRPPEERLPLDEATMFTSSSVFVTPEEAKGVMDRIFEVLEPYRAESRTDAPAGAGRLTFVLAAAPDVGPKPRGPRTPRRS